MLYAFCRERHIKYKRCGKLIVASDSRQRHDLEVLRDKALANGVTDIEWLEKNDILKLEPSLLVEAALLSPSSGIIDSHGYMLALQAEAEENGAMIAFHTPVIGGQVAKDGIILRIGGQNSMEICCRNVFNCAGLAATSVAKSIQGITLKSIPKQFFAKGSYFALRGKAPFSMLVYPLPGPAGLGVHMTMDLSGQTRFGPDVEWIDKIDYDVSLKSATEFYKAVRRYWPELNDGDLMPDYAGIRTKLSASGKPASDFMIQGSSAHNVEGLVNLFGIESPGLTASLAIAEHVVCKNTLR